MVKDLNTKWQFKGYAQANAGVIQNAAKENYSNLGLKVGGQVNYKGTYLGAEVGKGTATTGKIELGHEFDLGKNFGLDLSANANASQSVFTNKAIATAQTSVSVNDIQFNDQSISVTTWKPGEMSYGANVELTYKTGVAKFGLGVEGGMRQSTSPHIQLSANNTNVLVQKSEDGVEIETEAIAQANFDKDLNKRKAYITPTVSAEVNFGKNSHFSFVADAKINEANAGIRYTF